MFSLCWFNLTSTETDLIWLSGAVNKLEEFVMPKFVRREVSVVFHEAYIPG